MIVVWESHWRCIPVTFFSKSQFGWLRSSNPPELWVFLLFHSISVVFFSLFHIGSEIESKFFGADMVLFDDLFLFFLMYRVFFLPWRRLLEHSVRNRNRSRPSLRASRLECPVRFFFLFFSMLSKQSVWFLRIIDLVVNGSVINCSFTVKDLFSSYYLILWFLYGVFAWQWLDSISHGETQSITKRLWRIWRRLWRPLRSSVLWV